MRAEWDQVCPEANGIWTQIMIDMKDTGLFIPHLFFIFYIFLWVPVNKDSILPSKASAFLLGIEFRPNEHKG